MFDETLSMRIALLLERRNVVFETKKMFGGIAFMVDGKMCVGVMKDVLMARIDPEKQADLLKKEGCREMDFTTRPMKSMVYVDSWAIETDDELDVWIGRVLEYNPLAKSSKSRQKYDH
jgi:TfoX/Sxy family transcriptional regulator of competence genes